MFAARTEIEIAAPVVSVWQAMLDLRACSGWNPFIYRETGDIDAPQVGGWIALHVRPETSV